MKSRVPSKHLAPQWLANAQDLDRSFRFKVMHSPLRPLVDRVRRYCAAKFWSERNAKWRDRMHTLETVLGVWATTRIQHTGTMAVLDLSELPDDFPKDEAQMLPVIGMPYARIVTIPTLHYAFPAGLRGRRILGMIAGGIGDLILFSQLCQSLRDEHGCTVDIGHSQEKYSEELLEKIFSPGRIVKFPAPKQAVTYDYVLPLGMHGVLYGEDIPEYFARAYGTTLRCTGLPIDTKTARAVRRLVEIRHEMAHGYIVIHAGCRREKHYQHFDAVAQELVRLGHRVVLIGELADSALPDIPGKLANLCGQPLWESIAVVRHASLFVGPDSSFMHAAGAWNIPSVAIFGPTGAFWATPYPQLSVITYAATCRYLPCWVVLSHERPCGETWTPPCLRAIDPLDVVKCVERKIAGTMPKLYEIPRIAERPVIKDLRIRISG